MGAWRHHSEFCSHELLSLGSICSILEQKHSTGHPCVPRDEKEPAAQEAEGSGHQGQMQEDRCLELSETKGRQGWREVVQIS